MVLLQLKEPLQLFVKSREFHTQFLGRNITYADVCDVKQIPSFFPLIILDMHVHTGPVRRPDVINCRRQGITLQVTLRHAVLVMGSYSECPSFGSLPENDLNG